MRNKRESLRKCPVCDGPPPKGLRDYTWLENALPGRVGGSDIDFVVEQSSTGRVLMLEFKPGGIPITLGQRILFQRMVQQGFDFWVCWELSDDKIRVGQFTKEGLVLFVEELTTKQLARKITDWWYAGIDSKP